MITNMSFLIFISILLVIIVTSMHLVMVKVLIRLERRMGYITASHVSAAVLIAIGMHLLEIMVFAVGIALLANVGNYGQLSGQFGAGFTEYFYYSAVTYTTLGFGDITPEGSLRILTAIESLTGLVMSAWTASVIFWGMQRIGDTSKRG